MWVHHILKDVIKGAGEHPDGEVYGAGLGGSRTQELLSRGVGVHHPLCGDLCKLQCAAAEGMHIPGGRGEGDTCRQAGCWGFSLCPGLSGECVKYSEK